VLGRRFGKLCPKTVSDHYRIEGNIANKDSTVPFVVTIVATLLFSSYMLFDPAVWLASFMQLTSMALDFRIFILVLGCAYFCFAWFAEKYFLPRLAKDLGIAKERLGKMPKRRRAYKVIQEKMRI
jgi:cation-transporting P-type ATPase 13A2